MNSNEYEKLIRRRRIGTAHFHDLESAIKYFRDYLPNDPESTLKAFIDQKMKLGEIKLGPPLSYPGWRVLLWNNCRYYMEEV